MEIITINNLSFSYSDSDKKVLDNISLAINEGELVLVCGRSGCGKTTLVKNLKKVLMPKGKRQGEIYYRGISIDKLNDYEQATKIGYVMQDTDTQIVTDKVWHELAFGLENLGVESHVIKRRVAEIANYFGITDWFDKNTYELSGGQKQILNLASVMIMKPDVLILDEPMSQLCEVAANELLSMIKRINEELSTTVIIVEHRLENIYHMADKVVFMENGKVIECGTPGEVANHLFDNEYCKALPLAVNIYKGLKTGGNIPLNVKEGRQFISSYFAGKRECEIYPSEKKEGRLRKIFEKKQTDKHYALELKDIYFRYEKNGQDIIENLKLRLQKGVVSLLLGGNGSGKTTLLSVICGILKPYRGKIELFDNRIGYLPQNPEMLFVKDNVYDELLMVLDKKSVDSINEIAEKLDIKHCFNSHPYDLSGGEKQRVALAKVLLTKPDILLLDEPTKGFDVFHKEMLGRIIRELAADNTAILIVSHDTEFAAEYADECMMYFRGNIICREAPADMFSGNSFYTTAANRIAGDYIEKAITGKDVIDACMRITT